MELPGFKCFGCSTSNSSSLKLQIFANESGKVTTQFVPKEDHTSFPGVVHGGIQFTVLDDTAFWALLIRTKSLALTNASSVKYLKPLIIGDKIYGQAEVVSVENKKVVVNSRILNAKGEICTEGTYTFTLVATTAMEKMFNIKFTERFKQKLAALPSSSSKL